MTFRQRILGTALVVGLGACLPRPAAADTIDFTGLGRHVSNLSISVGSATGAVSAGELNWSWLTATPAGFATSFFTYCVDAVTALNDHQTVSISDTSGMASNVGAKVAWLFNTFAPTINATGTGVQAAALQIAIWEALYDSSANLTGGTFRLNTSGAVRTQATTYLTALYSSNYSDSHATWLDTARGQDQITQRVPEPATLLLMGLAALGMGVRRARQV